MSIVEGVEEELRVQVSRWEDPIGAGIALARRLDCTFVVTSARTGHNVDAVFEEMAREIMKHKQYLTDDYLSTRSRVDSLVVTRNKAAKKRACCSTGKAK